MFLLLKVPQNIALSVYDHCQAIASDFYNNKVTVHLDLLLFSDEYRILQIKSTPLFIFPHVSPGVDASTGGSVGNLVAGASGVAAGSSVGGGSVGAGSVGADSVGSDSVGASSVGASSVAGISVGGTGVAVCWSGSVGDTSVLASVGVMLATGVVVTGQSPVSTPASTPRTSLHTA
jgi:hypothetical protein